MHNKQYFEQLDREDGLAEYRSHFYIPQNKSNQDKVYLCGNSLGLQPKKAKQHILNELDRWQNLGIDGYFEGKTAWIDYSQLVRENAAKLVGAKEEEVILMNSLTTNLHLMMVSFYQPTESKCKVLMEQQAFPTDYYAVASQIQFHGYNPVDDLIIMQADGENGIYSSHHICHLIEKHQHELALILLPGVQYVTGQFFELETIVNKAKEFGITVGLDLAHAVGNVELDLHQWQVDFAVWCTYKYLNGGPGAPGMAFIHEKHFARNLPRFNGWWGNDKDSRFLMAQTYQAASDAQAWQLSNAPVLAVAPILASLQLFDQISMKQLRHKSIRMSQLLYDELANFSQVSVHSPKDFKQRGCQVTFGLKTNRDDTRALFEHLLENDIVGDWREPGIIRCSPVPLYTSFLDVYRLIQAIEDYFE